MLAHLQGQLEMRQLAWPAAWIKFALASISSSVRWQLQICQVFQAIERLEDAVQTQSVAVLRQIEYS